MAPGGNQMRLAPATRAYPRYTSAAEDGEWWPSRDESGPGSTRFLFGGMWIGGLSELKGCEQPAADRLPQTACPTATAHLTA